MKKSVVLIAWLGLFALPSGCSKTVTTSGGQGVNPGAKPAPVPPSAAQPMGPAAAQGCPDVLSDSTLMGHSAFDVSHAQVVTETAGTLTYTVTTGYLPIYATGTQSGAVQACLFFFSYTRDDHASDTAWPVTFLFNGGPGAPSDWIHLGGMGPKKMDFGPEGLTQTSSALGDDPDTLLANSDLVFIDPIQTGYSRVAKGVDPTSYNGLDQDADSVGDFIQGYLTKFGRMSSPKYILGESYGGMRLPRVGRYLDEKLGIKLAGEIFISPWLDAIGDENFGTTEAADDLPFLGALPAYAATAWYHKKLGSDLEALSLEQVYEKAETFANTDYIQALAIGDDLPADQKKKIEGEISALTGLSTDAIDAANLRVPVSQFRTEILKGTGETVGYYDGRIKATLKDPTTQDPYDAFDPLFSAADGQYFGKILGIVTDLDYAGNESWTSWPGAPDLGGIAGGYFNVLDDINTLLTNNPQLKVFMANGYYDMVCPAAEDHFMIRHLEPAVAARFDIHRYPGGHPIYFSDISHKQFAADVQSVYASTPVVP